MLTLYTLPLQTLFVERTRKDNIENVKNYKR